MFAQITILGTVGRKPELKHSKDGGKIFTNVGVAVSTGFGTNRETTWYRAGIFGDGAENACKYLEKGTAVLITGRPSIRVYKGKDGTPKAEMTISTSDWRMVGGGKRSDQSAADETPPSSSCDDLDGIPF